MTKARQSTLSEFGFGRPKALGVTGGIQKRKKLGGFQLTLRQILARRHGQRSFEGAFSGGIFVKARQYSSWRMPQLRHRFGGSGYDEMVRTALSRDVMARLHARIQNRKTASSFAAILSQDRANTDALVWYQDDGSMGGHPGALRDAPNGTGVNKGHGSRDIERAQATQHELKTAVPDMENATLSELRGAARHMAARAQVETLRAMSTPFEEFADRGKPTNTVVHARYGDLGDSGNLRDTAIYSQDQRERLKWDTARKLMGLGMPEHVPDVIRDHIEHAGGDHTQARLNFQEAVSHGVETRVNTSPRSQADALARSETLQQTRGRKRALSLPRIVPPKS